MAGSGTQAPGMSAPGKSIAGVAASEAGAVVNQPAAVASQAEADQEAPNAPDAWRGGAAASDDNGRAAVAPDRAVSALPLQDADTLAEQRALLGDALLEEVRTQFLADSTRLIAELAAALEAGAAQRLQAAAHEMKGAAGTIGLPRLAARAAALETAARQNSDPGGYARLLAALEADLTASRAALQSALEAPGAADLRRALP